jgi:hypothetical protein
MTTANTNTGTLPFTYAVCIDATPTDGKMIEEQPQAEELVPLSVEEMATDVMYDLERAKKCPFIMTKLLYSVFNATPNGHLFKLSDKTYVKIETFHIQDVKKFEGTIDVEEDIVESCKKDLSEYMASS